MAGGPDRVLDSEGLVRDQQKSYASCARFPEILSDDQHSQAVRLRTVGWVNPRAIFTQERLGSMAVTQAPQQWVDIAQAGQRGFTDPARRRADLAGVQGDPAIRPVPHDRRHLARAAAFGGEITRYELTQHRCIPFPERLVPLFRVRSGVPHLLPATREHLGGLSGRELMRAAPLGGWYNRIMFYLPPSLWYKRGTYLLLALLLITFSVSLLRPELKGAMRSVMFGLLIAWVGMIIYELWSRGHRTRAIVATVLVTLALLLPPLLVRLIVHHSASTSTSMHPPAPTAPR
ncbi:hypothetical protein GCM10008955_01000 [Deinococcus malanensis]|uniref:Uncharacterized protein n=1 Tax=Deinococcus malanensis TaxID=1706855 RepID=A0ABQ2EGS1_9DEIO|nr:hypothetical protein GCM10008955_01000 [Deinococcus malanensis]